MYSNGTSDTQDKDPPLWFDIFRAVSLFASVFLIISGNIFCIFVIRDSTQMRKVSRIFMLSLIVADLCGGILPSGSLLATVATVHWTSDILLGVFCKVFFIAGFLFNGASFLSLLTVILDCYIAVEKPLRYPSLLTARRAYTITLTNWVVVSCVAILYSVGFGGVSHFRKEWHWCMLDDNFSRSYSYVLLLIVYCGLTVVIPLVLTVILYTRIRLIVRRHMSHLTRATQTGRLPHLQRPSETKSLTTFLIVTCGIAITSLPLSILVLYSHWTGDYSMYWISAAMMLRSCNNLLNVLVHIRRNKEFRTTASRLLCRCGNRQEDSRGTGSNSTQLSSIATAVTIGNR